jgi:hypothetical protein
MQRGSVIHDREHDLFFETSAGLRPRGRVCEQIGEE